MTAQELAALLHGRTYGYELTKAEEVDAKASGLVVVFGASDDLMEFRGAIDDEIGANDGTTACITPLGLLKDFETVDHTEEDCEAWFKLKALGVQEIHAIWCPPDMPGTSWRFATSISHETFDVMEDGDIYCRGIVFALADVAQGAAS